MIKKSTRDLPACGHAFLGIVFVMPFEFKVYDALIVGISRYYGAFIMQAATAQLRCNYGSTSVNLVLKGGLGDFKWKITHFSHSARFTGGMVLP